MKSAGDDYNLWVLLSQTSQAIYKARQRDLSEHDISVIEGAVLYILYHKRRVQGA